MSNKTKLPDGTCLGCHFLCTKSAFAELWDPLDANRPLTVEERGQLTNDKEAESVLSTIEGCVLGVWRPAQKPKSPASILALVNMPREPQCFFLRHTDGLPYPGAVRIEARAANWREAAKDRELTRRAFWVAAGALGISFITALATLYTTAKTP